MQHGKFRQAYDRYARLSRQLLERQQIERAKCYPDTGGMEVYILNWHGRDPQAVALVMNQRDDFARLRARMYRETLRYMR